MKKLFFLIPLFISIGALAQTPGTGNQLYIDLGHTVLASLPTAATGRTVMVDDSNHRVGVYDGTQWQYLAWIRDITASVTPTLQDVISAGATLGSANTIAVPASGFLDLGDGTNGLINIQTKNFNIIAAQSSGVGAGGWGVASWSNITTGTSTTGVNIIRNYAFNFSSTIAAYAFTMPAVPFDGMEVGLHFGGTITTGTVVTTLTVSANSGQTLIQNAAPITAVAGDYIMYRWNATNLVWYREH